MNKRQFAKLEKRLPAVAVAALNAASKRAAESGLPRVLVIDNGLYRVSATGAKELIRTLPPMKRVRRRAKRSKA